MFRTISFRRLSRCVRLSGLVAGLSAMIATTAFAGMQPAPHDSLPAVAFQRAELTVIGPDGAQVYTPATLEQLGTQRLATRTPWRDTPAEFVGVRFSDLLVANGLGDVASVRVTAENDYAVDIPREVWERWPFLIATRVDGAPHKRRERGPLQFVFDQDDAPEVGERSFEYYWVWMAKRIEPSS